MEHILRKNCRPKPGQHFTAGGRDYELAGGVGNGAVGLVRKAQDRASGRTVAVKFLAPDPKYIDPDAFPDVAQRFKREGERGAKLNHEHLVRILAYEQNENGKNFLSGAVKNPFVVMEYVRGHTLESLIHRLEPGIQLTTQTLSIAARIADALTYLHRQKIVHRDVKPANVFLSTAAVGAIPSVVKLGDFGVTKWGDFLATAASGTLTTATQRGLGTLKYMSPEQAVRPKDVGVRSDMFSFGISLFELFTGRLLPSPHHVFEIMSARQARGSVGSKMVSLGFNCSMSEAAIFEIVLDMFLTGPNGRPASSRVQGQLEYYYELADSLAGKGLG
jgi:serine/threonine protein kinase